ncbi:MULTISPECIES: hypothetical protein [Streptomyces]|uniref:Uncharacterized protein n=2 Tax=Streptomyces rimosus subsp. rimosus TaxID=132474 RepID=A0A8A1UHP1_STRR1|nr:MULTISPECIES: hypothetical protein [Streptomyces]MYT42422.1 hypothetical protein [Streptomyces sp. SID5471]QGY66348.1 hypothetical protein V519_010880 [Streptomyces rimosus R6-500]QST79447.1 hypothetical protein SRIM_003980 [Streptomyces rimosus subsp. rimosus ATCC 10970]UNZ07799.1 hypothetical protein SRIMR7_37155 [Streptomyces rimosus subsp. rimosus]UTH93518.1 hypothetical protein SRIMHP_05220 [Streptomyces rimosus subsp. rimosus]
MAPQATPPARRPKRPVLRIALAVVATGAAIALLVGAAAVALEDENTDEL